MQIKIGTYEWNTPDSWNEMPLHLLQPAYVILKAGDFAPVIRLSELTKVLLNIDDDFLSKWRDYYTNEHGLEDGEAIWSEDWSKLVSAATFPFIENVEQKDGQLAYQIDLSLTKCPYPTLIIPTTKGDMKLWACASGFENITIGEFARIDTLFQQFQSTGDVAHIYECLAVIWRPHKEKSKRNQKEKYQGDKRLPLSVAQFSEKNRIQLFKQLSEGSTNVLWFWIASCREQILRKWKNVLNPSGGAKGNYWDKQLQKFGWTGLFIEMATASGQTEMSIADMSFEDVFVKLAYLETKRKAEKANTPKT